MQRPAATRLFAAAAARWQSAKQAQPQEAARPAALGPANANGQIDSVDLAVRPFEFRDAYGVTGVELELDPIAMPDPIPAPSRAAVVKIG
jgi:hypothetical protein